MTFVMSDSPITLLTLEKDPLPEVFGRVHGKFPQNRKSRAVRFRAAQKQRFKGS